MADEELFIESETGPTNHIEIAADIVAAYVANNALPVADLPTLIASVHAALIGLGGEAVANAADTVEKATPAQIRKSITPDALISFVDGKPYKTLKRHLGSNGLNIHAYRQRYGLPADYPSTAPGYSAQRSELARALGLGQQRRTQAPRAAETSADAPSKAKGRGRPRKAAQAAAAE